MTGCGAEEAKTEEAKINVEKKYGGLLPRKKPLISTDAKRAFFDSADWALRKNGAVATQVTEFLRPKLQVCRASCQRRNRGWKLAARGKPGEKQSKLSSKSLFLVRAFHLLSDLPSSHKESLLPLYPPYILVLDALVEMPPSPTFCQKKKQWWLSRKRVVEKHLKDSRTLISTEEPSDVQVALGLLDSALSISPRNETALELRARCLLFLRRFREVADMLQDYIPSFRAPEEVGDSFTSISSDNSSSSRERSKLLPSSSSSSDDENLNSDGLLHCLSLSNVKRKILGGLYRDCTNEGAWRYTVLGKACCHLGMMEDAMILLQTARRIAMMASRKESRYLSEDGFSAPCSSPPLPSSELENSANLLSHIKLLLRRRAAAAAALDAGLAGEAVRHFSKILDGRRGTPHGFATGCFIGRAAAFRAAEKIADAIADCNRALALDPASITALRARAELLETVNSLPDCLRDLDHLKLLYDAILRDRKLPGPPWRRHNGIVYRDIAGDLREIASRSQRLRETMARGEAYDVNYYALLGVRRCCTRSELERAHVVLSLKHRPDKAAAFVERLEFSGECRDLDAVKDQAKMSALMLYRLLHKGYSSIMGTVLEEEAAERQRVRAVAAAQAACAAAVVVPVAVEGAEEKKAQPVFQGVFCRDLAAVGSLLSQANFNRGLSVKCQAMC